MVLKPRKNYSKMAKKAVAKTKSNAVTVSQKSTINPLIKKYVKQAIAKEDENKFFTSDIAIKQAILGTGFNTTGAFGWNSLNNIIPVIQQGVGQQQRVGNKIRPTSFVVRGHVLALPVNSTTNNFPNMPFYVRICVWRQKQSMTTISNTQILDNGVSAGGNDFDGTLDDLLVPYNKDRFEIGVSRQFVLQPNASAGTASSENLSKYPVSKMFKFKVPIPKTFMYNDAALDPSNCRWYMSAGIVNHDGTLSVTTNSRAQITAVGVLHYTDA